MRIALESNCPHCGSWNLRRSRQTGLLTHVLRGFTLKPYRCRSCFRRFFGPRAAPANRQCAAAS